MLKLWAVVYSGQQKEVVRKRCFSCTKQVIGELRLDGVHLIPCTQEHCEHEEEVLDVGECDIDATGKRQLMIRKLKEVDPEIEIVQGPQERGLEHDVCNLSG